MAFNWMKLAPSRSNTVMYPEDGRLNIRPMRDAFGHGDDIVMVVSELSSTLLQSSYFYSVVDARRCQFDEHVVTEVVVRQ